MTSVASELYYKCSVGTDTMEKICVNQYYMYVLIGTTRKEHLQDAIDALSILLSEEDI